MKNYLRIIYFLCLTAALILLFDVKVRAQQPDLLIDKCYAMQTLQVWYKTYTVQDSLNWSDPFVHGYKRVGTHAYLGFGTKVASVGPVDFSIGPVYCGSAFCHPEFFYLDPIHGHEHQIDFFDIQLRQVSCQPSAVLGWKLSFAFVDYERFANGTVNGHYVNVLDACQTEWLEENNVYIDSAWAYLNPNDNFNSNQPGITRGFADVYGPRTEGNWLIITGEESGWKTLSIQINPPAYTNEAGPGPNYIDFDFYYSKEDTAVYYIGQTAPEPVCCDAGNPDPQQITVSGNNILWDSTGACDFEDLEILIWNEKRNEQPEYHTAAVIPITTETSYVHVNKLSDKDLQRYARQLPWGFNGGKFSYRYKIGETISE